MVVDKGILVKMGERYPELAIFTKLPPTCLFWDMFLGRWSDMNFINCSSTDASWYQEWCFPPELGPRVGSSWWGTHDY